MNILYEDKERVGFIADTLNDLLSLASVIRQGDIVKSKTVRKIKVTETDAERRLITVKLRVEKVEVVSDVPKLRILGTIVECDDPQVQLQSHHSIDIELHRQFEIEKEQWNKIDILVIKRAIEQSKKILFTAILIDDSNALIAEIAPRGYSIKVEFSSDASKESEAYDKQQSRYIEKIVNYLKNSKVASPLIVAGPGFAKDKLIESINNTLKLSVIKESVSYVNHSGLIELINSEKIASLIKDYWVAEQEKVVNSFIAHLAKYSTDVIYGLKQVEEAINYSAISQLLIYEPLLNNKNIRALADQCIDKKVPVIIISPDSSAGEKFKSFGIGGFVKFQWK